MYNNVNVESVDKGCKLCPHKCNVDRSKKFGRCKMGDNITIAKAELFFYEEPCISGDNGSGAIFFSGCNLNCVYCQNKKISQERYGKEISIEHLANIFLKFQERKANNINLVTPTIFVDKIIEAIKIAKKQGLTIPIIYNCGGYESEDIIDKLNGYIDVYLPDLKYLDENLAQRYSKIKNYPEIANKAIIKMYNQVGKPKLNSEGIIQKGVIIRHLILPNNIQNSKDVLKWIKDTFGANVLVSVMAQYFPTNEAYNYPEINRKITQEEYKQIEDYIYEIGIEDGYIQELGEHEEEYVPNFDLSEIK